MKKRGVLIISLIVILLGFSLLLLNKSNFTGFATYSGQSDCGATISEDSTLAGNVGECDDTIGQGFEGLKINTNSIVLNCLSNSIIGAGSQGKGINISANNILIKNCKINKFDYELQVEGINNVIQDSILSLSAASDINVLTNKNATLLNTTHSTERVLGVLEVQWYIDINVTNSSGAVSGATVYATNGTNRIYSGTTGANGMLRLNATQYVNNSGTKTLFESYKINATTASQNGTNSTILTTNKVVNIVLQDSGGVSVNAFPTINFTSPTLSSSTYSQTSITVNVTALDPETALDKIRIYLYNLTSLVNSSVSSSSSPLYINFTNLPYTTYYLNASANDTAGNINWTEKRTIILQALTPDNYPNATLISPINSRITNQTSANFSCNATDDLKLANLTLYLWNPTSIYSTNRSTVTGISNQSNYSYILPEGNYTWNCLSQDNSSQVSFATSNRTLVIDTTLPSLSFSCSPSNLNISTTTTCSCTPSDSLTGANLSSLAFTASPATNVEGTFTVYCNVSDYAGNFKSQSASYTVVVPTSTTTNPGTGGGGATTSCTNDCSSGQKEEFCLTNKTLRTKTCGNYDSDSCLEWSSDTDQECSLECKDSQCTENLNCTDSCNSSLYPKCSGNFIERCEKSSLGCYEIKKESCPDNQSCQNNECSLMVETPLSKSLGKLSSVLGNPNLTAIPKPSSVIPHGSIPDVAVDATVYTATTAAVVYSLNLLWLWLLTLFLPFFALRLRHFCLAIIDSNLILPLISQKGKSYETDNKEVQKFLTLLENKFGEKIQSCSFVKNTQRYLFKKSGFLEIETEFPLVINAHFNKKRKMKKFKGAFLKTIEELYGNKKKEQIKNQILTTRESTSIIPALRRISRERKMNKINQKFMR